MTTITDPEAIRFVNEQIRPLAERLRAEMVLITSIETSWFAGLSSKFPNDASLVDDHRDAEGVSRLTGADINSLMSIAIGMRNAGNTGIISKPCVRGLSVS